MEKESKDEIKEKILSRIERLKSLKENQPDIPLEKHWQQDSDLEQQEFYQPPKWQDHLSNVNKLWNIFSDEETVRTGILHEINESWSLSQVFESEEYQDLTEILSDEPKVDSAKRPQFFKESKKLKHKTDELLQEIFKVLQIFCESQKEFNAKIVRSTNTFFDLFTNAMNVQKTFNAETVRFINEYIGIEEPESQG